MKLNEIKVHIGGKEEVRRIEAAEELTFEKLAEELAKQHFGGCRPEEILFFEEDCDGEELRGVVIVEGRRPRIHCHRCKHAEVTVIFENQSKKHAFRPGERLRRIIDWAKSDKGFNLDKGAKLVLRAGPDTEALDNDAHVGSFVKEPACSVTFYLTPAERIQG